MVWRMFRERSHFTSLLLLLLVPASVLVSERARAQESGAAAAGPSKPECAQAFEEAQRLRNASRYLDANREVLTCTNPSCGAALSEECGKIYSELQAATPSVVFAARDRSGKEVAGATVQVDDSENARSFDGRPVSLDPGSHTFAFRAAGFEPQAQAVVIRAGERLRPITVVLQSAPTSREPSEAASGRAVTELTPSSDDVAPAQIPTGVYVLSGVAVAGVGGFIGLRWWGSHDFDELSRTCKPDCSRSSVDAVEQKYVLSSVSLAVGAAAAVGAVTWYFAARPSRTQSAAQLQLSPSPGGVSARFSASF
jgi:hypothetical protein